MIPSAQDVSVSFFGFCGRLCFVKNFALASTFASCVIFGTFFVRFVPGFLVLGRSCTLYGSGGVGVMKVIDDSGSHIFLLWSTMCLFLWKAWCLSFSVRGRVVFTFLPDTF